jgi:hypothetical protein
MALAATAAMVLQATIRSFTCRSSRKSVISIAYWIMVSADFTPYGTRAVSPKYRMFSCGRWRMSARATVSPPMPESNTPIGESGRQTIIVR